MVHSREDVGLVRHMNARWHVIAAVTTLVVAVTFFGSPAGAQTGSLSLSPSSGPPTSGFTATVNGFPSCPGGFAVIWDDPAVVYRGGTGFPTATSFVPLRTSIGPHTVRATCITGDTPPATLSATGTFVVTAPPETVSPVPRPAPPPQQVAPVPLTPTPPTVAAPAPIPVPEAIQPIPTTTTTALGTGASPALGATAAPRRAASDSDDDLPAWLILAGFVALVLAAIAMLLAYGIRRGRAFAPVEPVEEPVAVPRRNLGGVADVLLGDHEVPALARGGPASARITEACGGSDEVATPLIATLMWESFVTDERFQAVLDELGASDRALAEGQILVVRHAGDTRHDLLVLDPGFAGAGPTGVPVEVWPSATTASSRRDELSWAGLMSPDGREPWPSLDEDTIARAIEEAAQTEKFGVIVAAPPAVLSTWSPSPAWPVGVGGKRAPVATVGVVVEAPDGSPAVTTALHNVTGQSAVFVSRRPATIMSVHEPTDSCLLAVPDLQPDDRGRGGAGPMQGLVPRQHERVAFDGVGSGQSTTTVTAWDLSVLRGRPDLASKVYTAPDTVPGDSGAALIDSGDQIIGFAVHRSAFGEPIEYSAWVWADQVLDAHGARLWRASRPDDELVHATSVDDTQPGPDSPAS